ncbi:uncharacterized [Lates japonicus]
MHGWACGRAAVRILLPPSSSLARTAGPLIGGNQQEERKRARVVRSVKFSQTSQLYDPAAAPDPPSLQTTKNTAPGSFSPSLVFRRSRDKSADVAAAF